MNQFYPLADDLETLDEFGKMATSLTDGQLVKEVLNGDKSCFGILVSRYAKSVKSMLLKRNISNVDDILQEAFVKAYLNLVKYDDRYPFGGWVMTIAKNLSIDNMRKPSLNCDGKISIDVPSLYPDPEQIVVRAQQAQRIQTMMDKLSKTYRVILSLRFDEELSYEEIAEKLNIPVGTVKTHIHRARQALMNLMSSDNNE